MKAKGGTWTFQTLSTYLTAPQAVVPGTKMGFAGLPRPEERAALIAYINKTYSDQPLDINGSGK
jgi:cytochrome c